MGTFRYHLTIKYKNMKNIIIVIAILLCAIKVEAQEVPVSTVLGVNFYYDSTLLMPYIHINSIYWTAISKIPTRRMYLRLVAYDMVSRATVDYHIKDSSNYNDVYSGSISMAISTHNIDTARVGVVNYIVRTQMVDTLNNPIFTIQP